tara:strand:- start:2645 stop:4423 length:1779 start_codon:yes stop_codon:yes gene_type:complete
MKYKKDKYEHLDLEDKDISISPILSDLVNKESLTKTDAKLLIDELFIPFSAVLTGFDLYDYQKEVFTGIVFNVIMKYEVLMESDSTIDISVLIARQSGKSSTIAVTVFTLGVLLPALSKIFKAEQFKQFKDGFKVGVYGPDYDKAGIIYGKIKDCASSENAMRVMSDPDINIDLSKVKGLKFPNGFSVDLRTANKTSKLEGFTYDLLVIDECQDIDSYVIRRSLSPMRAATGGAMICVGTPIPTTCHFSEMCAKHKLMDIKAKRTSDKVRSHYEFDYTNHARHNVFYKKLVEQEMYIMGEYSDEFRMAYKVEWVKSRSTLITGDELNKCGILRTRTESAKVVVSGKTTTVKFKRGHACVASDLTTPEQVFSLDFGKVHDSTVMTVAKVWWDNPVKIGDDYRYHIHIQDWFEITGDHEEQHPQIIEKILKYSARLGVCDATGKGDPIYSRLSGELIHNSIDVHPFIFTSKSKHQGYTLLKQEISAGRVTFPNGAQARKSKKNKNFKRQLSNLVKEYKNNYMKISHPKMSGFHDDYADSLMMLVWAIHNKGIPMINFYNKDVFNQRTSRHSPQSIYNRTLGMSGKSVPKKRNWS